MRPCAAPLPLWWYVRRVPELKERIRAATGEAFADYNVGGLGILKANVEKSGKSVNDNRKALEERIDRRMRGN